MGQPVLLSSFTCFSVIDFSNMNKCINKHMMITACPFDMTQTVLERIFDMLSLYAETLILMYAQPVPRGLARMPHIYQYTFIYVIVFLQWYVFFHFCGSPAMLEGPLRFSMTLSHCLDVCMDWWMYYGQCMFLVNISTKKANLSMNAMIDVCETWYVGSSGHTYYQCGLSSLNAHIII